MHTEWLNDDDDEEEEDGKRRVKRKEKTSNATNEQRISFYVRCHYWLPHD